ncbi:MAG: hypothetical protein ABIG28_01105 [archaeon]
MKGIDGFGVVAGIVLIIAGIGMLIGSIFFWPLIVYALITLILGIVILMTLKQQEYIEPIKNKRNKKGDN